MSSDVPPPHTSPSAGVCVDGDVCTRDLRRHLPKVKERRMRGLLARARATKQKSHVRRQNFASVVVLVLVVGAVVRVVECASARARGPGCACCAHWLSRGFAFGFRSLAVRWMELGSASLVIQICKHAKLGGKTVPVLLRLRNRPNQQSKRSPSVLRRSWPRAATIPPPRSPPVLNAPLRCKGVRRRDVRCV